MLANVRKVPDISRNGQGVAQTALPASLPSLLSRIKSKFQWEDLVVAGREVRGLVVPPWAAAVFLTAILGGGGYAWKTVSDGQRENHDALIILKTQKEDAEKLALQEHNDRALQESADKAWREKMSNQMAELKMQIKPQN